MATANESTHPPYQNLFGRIWGALRLAPATYRELERDPRALPQAFALVLAAGAARGVGAIENEGIAGIVGSTAVGLATWLAAGALISTIGRSQSASSATLSEVMRTLGFAAAPLLVLVLRAVPLGPAGSWLWFGAHVWATLALAMATREALDITTAKALLICLAALVAGVALLALLGMFVGQWGAFD